MKIGRHENISNKDYHDDSALSKSKLDAVNVSYENYLYSISHHKESPELTFGSAFHSLILTPELNDVAVAPPCDKRTKAGKELWETFIGVNQNKTIISSDDYQTIMCMNSAIMAHPKAKELMEAKGKAEVSYWWKDTDTGLMCKCRNDWEVGTDFIVDLKSTKDASKEEFAKSVANYRYHVQDAWYKHGSLIPKFIFIAVEKTPPYGVGVYELDAAASEYGMQIARKNLATIKKYQDEPWVYKGYSDQIETLGLPPWAFSYQEATI